MDYKHYNKSELFITSSNNDCKFRRYLTDDNSRLIQYIEGTLIEILPEDFDKETTIYSGSLMATPLIASYAKYPLNIIRVEFNDEVTRIGTDPKKFIFQLGAMSNDQQLHVIFPPNLQTIQGSIGQMAGNIWDFSKLTHIPAWQYSDPVDTDVRSACFNGEIRIPATLYDSWTKATNWSEVADNMIAV